MLSIIRNLSKHMRRLVYVRNSNATRAYWEKRYSSGGNSGRGSYGRLQSFKTAAINDIAVRYRLHSAVEFGCGDGAQLAGFAFTDYHGVDVSATVIAQNRAHYKANPSRSFWDLSEISKCLAHGPFDVALSLDVIFHLVNDLEFDTYMRNVFASNCRFVIVYSSNYYEGPRSETPHVRHRRFTDWIDDHASQYRLLEMVENPYSRRLIMDGDQSNSDFYVFGSTAVQE